MHKYQIVMLPMAEEDILRNTDYIAYDKKSPNTALQLSRGFRKIIDSLSMNPGRHELDEDEQLAYYGIRKYYYKNYKIYYLVSEAEEVVYILGVFHMRVDSKAVLLRRFALS